MPDASLRSSPETPSPTSEETPSPTSMKTPSPTSEETPSPTSEETPSATSMESLSTASGELLAFSSSKNFFNSNGQAAWPFRLVARHPRVTLAVAFVLQLSVWIATISLAAAGKDVLAVKFDQLPIQIVDSAWYKRALAVTSARLNFGLPSLTNADWHPVASDWVTRARIDLTYRFDGNILTEDPLNAIRQFEKKLASNPKLLEYFHYVSFFSAVPSAVTVLSNSVVKTIINIAFKNETYRAYFPIIFPPDFQHHPKLFSESRMLRTVLIPKSWKIYSSQEYKEFTKGPLLTALSNQGKNGSVGAEVTFAYWSLEFYQLAVSDQGLKDSLFAIGSFFFILLVILLHTRSFALTAAAVFGILTALLSANLIYRYAVGHRYIGVFHAISIFLLLGIGADDVFVLFDAWRDSFGAAHASEAHRLSWVLKRAGAATFITSLTSATAFLVNAGCRVLLVSTFGIFTGIAVFVNYCIAVTFLPVVLLNIWISCKDSTRMCCQLDWSQGKRRVARVFEKYVFRRLRSRAVVIVSLVVCGVMSVIFIWQSTNLKPGSSILTQMFKRGTNFYRAEKLSAQMKRSRPIEVVVSFGIDPQDLSSCPKDDFNCYGKYQWLENFDLNLPGSQQALLKFCRGLRTDLSLRTPLNLAPHPNNGSENHVMCFLDDMERDMNLPRFQKCPGDPRGAPLDLRIPITRPKIERLLQCYPDLFANGSHALSPQFSRAYEVGLSWWLLKSKSKNARYTTNNVVMTFKGGAPELGELGGRLRFAAISAFTRFTGQSASFFEGAPVRANWEAVVRREAAAFPTEALRKGFQCTQASSEQSALNFWEWFDIQEALWDNARVGLLVGLLGVALPVLFLATRNIILTLAGVLCLAFATGGVITMANAFGWPLGVSESINFALVTGLSVDYVVHFIEAYHQAGRDHHDRASRVQHMLMRVGGAVFSGVISTLGAVVFLFGSNLLIFIQFGVFLGSAIFFAFFAAIFFLTPFLLLVGPEGDFASLDPLLAAAWQKLKSCC